MFLSVSRCKYEEYRWKMIFVGVDIHATMQFCVTGHILNKGISHEV